MSIFTHKLNWKYKVILFKVLTKFFSKIMLETKKHINENVQNQFELKNTERETKISDGRVYLK